MRAQNKAEADLLKLQRAGGLIVERFDFDDFSKGRNGGMLLSNGSAECDARRLHRWKSESLFFL